MQKRVFLMLVLCLFLINFAAADEIQNEMKKLTYYAGEYETGNINYAQLMIYGSSVKENIQIALGASQLEENQGRVVSAEKLRSVLGEPKAGYGSMWAWSQTEQKDVKLDKEAPVWKKVVFDGEKIQVQINAYPVVFKKDGAQNIYYNIDVSAEFKLKKDYINFNEEIEKIKGLAEQFNTNPSNENKENLARKSVEIERAFEFYYNQGGGNSKECSNLLDEILGSESKRKTNKISEKKGVLYKGEWFDIVLRMETCEDCEWKWIGLDIWPEGRFDFDIESGGSADPEKYKAMSSLELKEEIKRLINECKEKLEKGEYKSALSVKTKIWALNEAWNQKANDVWQDVEKESQQKRENMGKEEMNNYGWDGEQKGKEEKVKKIQEQNFESRKKFYDELFSGLSDVREKTYEQLEYEKRLVEVFKIFMGEVCNNGIDDNNNQQIDCDEDGCGGDVCGSKDVVLANGNESEIISTKMYCIEKKCQVKPENLIFENKSVCGNHICENGENESCLEDCNQCPVYEAIKCDGGKVIFKGKDANGCNLEAVCIKENASCEKNEDCEKPLCGEVQCIEGMCKTTSLEVCNEKECVDGATKIERCSNDEEIVIELCTEGTWKNTGYKCSSENACTNESECVEEKKEEVVGNKCSVREDCGGENDVCSNGNCVSLPKVEEKKEVIEDKTNEEKKEENVDEGLAEKENINENKKENANEKAETDNQEKIEKKNQEENIEQKIEEKQEQKQEEKTEEQGGETTITGNVISAVKKFTGFIISGFAGEEGEESSETGSESSESSESNEQTNEGNGEQKEENNEKQEIEHQEGNTEEKGEQKEQSGQEQENEQQNNEERRDNKEENRDEQQDNENENENNKYEKENRKEEKKKEEQRIEEKTVFKAGGNCRSSGSESSAGIYFDGWGEPFGTISQLKMQFYTDGRKDWCKKEFENVKMQRKEMEKSINSELASWFFEKYMVNSAENWESYISGIFEIYWKNVEISRRMAEISKCMGLSSMPEHKLLNMSYESEFGSVEYWEELKIADIEGIGKTEAISPYMKVWVFPPKKFIKNEMKESMKNHEFPGPSEEKNKGQGPTEYEKEMLRKNEPGFVEKIREASDKYGGSINAVVQVMDGEELVFNLYAVVDDKVIMSINPMPYEEVPEEDVKIIINFDSIYELIYLSEKDMRGSQIEMPPWDKSPRPVQKVKQIVDGVKMWWKVKSMIGSAKIIPESAEGDVKDLFTQFFKMSMKGDGEGNGQEDNKKGNNENEENSGEMKKSKSLTGNVIVDIEDFVDYIRS